jgi:hypothetical protein
MKKVYIVLFMLFLCFSGFGQDLNINDVLQALLDQALEINVAARVYLPNQEPMLCVENSTLTTIPGRSVAVTIQGGNLIIKAVLTPYKSETNELILVAQGQVWLNDNKIENAVQYLSSFESIPVNLGETIRFFPLGVSEEIANTEYLNIELAIQIVPFVE